MSAQRAMVDDEGPGGPFGGPVGAADEQAEAAPDLMPVRVAVMIRPMVSHEAIGEFKLTIFGVLITCVFSFWGSSAFGLEPEIDVDGLTLHMVKTSNATWGHYGEMAGGQPWVIV